ncbi:MAG: nucleoside monophosphate kinase [Patescibacteria group bacterium]
METKDLKIVFLGPPTSGKGTQAEVVAQELNLIHISTGEIFRKHVAEKTELGLQVKELIENGRLVADDLTNEVVENKLVDIRNGFILDGYPRSVAQAIALDEMTQITHAFFIKISDDEVIRRVANRRVCSVCGKLHTVSPKDTTEDKNICRECGGQLELRSDDTEKVMRQRLQEYHEITEPMVEFYRQEKVLVEINGEQPVEKITQEILTEIKK